MSNFLHHPRTLKTPNHNPTRDQRRAWRRFPAPPAAHIHIFRKFEGRSLLSFHVNELRKKSTQRAPYPDCMHIRETRDDGDFHVALRAGSGDCITGNEPGRSRFLHEQMWPSARARSICVHFAFFQQQQLLDLVANTATTNDTTLPRTGTAHTGLCHSRVSTLLPAKLGRSNFSNVLKPITFARAQVDPLLTRAGARARDLHRRRRRKTSPPSLQVEG